MSDLPKLPSEVTLGDILEKVTPEARESRVFLLVAITEHGPKLAIQGPPAQLAEVLTSIMTSMFDTECEYHILRSVSPDCPPPTPQ